MSETFAERQQRERAARDLLLKGAQDAVRMLDQGVETLAVHDYLTRILRRIATGDIALPTRANLGPDQPHVRE